MTRAIRRLALTLLAVVWVAVALPTMAVAQVPPPTLTTTINPPPANQPFEAVFNIFASPDSYGFGPEPFIRVNGNSISIYFIAGCGQPCAPRSYSAFPFTMPALPPGDYLVSFSWFLPSPPIIYAQLPLTVAGGAATPVAVPSMSTRWLAALALLLVVVGTGLLQRRPFRSHS